MSRVSAGFRARNARPIHILYPGNSTETGSENQNEFQCMQNSEFSLSSQNSIQCIHRSPGITLLMFYGAGTEVRTRVVPGRVRFSTAVVPGIRIHQYVYSCTEIPPCIAHVWGSLKTVGGLKKRPFSNQDRPQIGGGGRRVDSG